MIIESQDGKHQDFGFIRLGPLVKMEGEEFGNIGSGYNR